ncbi:MAG: transglycosylase SLT domain-containing protein [Rhizobiaceae bacterium]|nr:transglycosylase SLT domain-containing protein [Rhizobiaceae bacterium]
MFVAAALAAGVISVAAKAGELPMDRAGSLTRVVAKAAPAKRVEKPSRKKAEVALVARERKARKPVRARAPRGLDTMTTAAITAAGAARGAGEALAYSAIIARYASEYKVPLPLAHAVIQVESNYRPGIVGRAGEIGLMQIKPATARMLGYGGTVAGLHDPETNIRFGMKYLSMARELGDGSTCGTILKYNAGHAATRMNPTSSAYCAKVTKLIAGL